MLQAATPGARLATSEPRRQFDLLPGAVETQLVLEPDPRVRFHSGVPAGVACQ